MINNLYIKYPILLNDIKKLLVKTNKKFITFFIDLQSIARGLYNKKIVELEIAKYTENKELNTLPEELEKFIENIKINFINYDVFFVIFYDNGKNIIHKNLNKNYKSNRSYSFEDSIYEEIYKKIKKLYFIKIYEFNKYNDISVIYLDKYETDFIPYFVIKNNIINTLSKDNLNIILSTDKDLLQCLQFNNTFQMITSYKQRNWQMKLFDDYNAIQYMYKNFKPGILTSKYVPAILAIAGDKSDNIRGVKGVGYAKAIQLIIKYNINYQLKNIDKVNDKKIKDNIDLIKTNYKLTSFEEYIKLLPLNVKENILNHF